MISRQELAGPASIYQFEHVMDIVAGVVPRFVPIREVTSDSAVYLWVSPLPHDEDRIQVLYVGKAGTGIPQRMREHAGGFVNSTTGRANRDLIVELLNAGRQVQVWARRSRVESIFGVPVSLCSAEEIATYHAMSPLWNRVKLRRADMNVVGARVQRPEEQVQIPVQRAPDEFLAADALADLPVPEVHDFTQALTPDKQGLLVRAIALLQDRRPEGHIKVVAFHTGQPRGYSCPTLVVARRLTADGKALEWGRIPLCDEPTRPLTLVFPRSDRVRDLPEHEYVTGPSEAWCPANLQSLLDNPARFLR